MKFICTYATGNIEQYHSYYTVGTRRETGSGNGKCSFQKSGNLTGMDSYTMRSTIIAGSQRDEWILCMWPVFRGQGRGRREIYLISWLYPTHIHWWAEAISLRTTGNWGIGKGGKKRRELWVLTYMVVLFDFLLNGLLVYLRGEGGGVGGGSGDDDRSKAG